MRVLITGGEGKSTLAAVRSLAARGVEVHVVAGSRLAVSCWSRYPKRRHLLAPAKTDPQEFVEGLRRLQAKWQFDVMMPVGPDEVLAVLEAGLGSFGSARMALPGKDVFEVGLDKSKTLKAARAARVAIPVTYFPDEEAISEIRDRATYPVLIKPNISAGARGICVVKDKVGLLDSYEETVKRWGPSHLQEWVPPGGGQFKSDILVGDDGSVLGLFVCEKLRFFPVEGGSSTLVVSRRRPDIEEATVRMAKEMKWFGFADFDFIVDPRDGGAKLMECNPRFAESLSIDIFAGVEFPWMLAQLALGRAVEVVREYRLGLYARFLVGDLMWFLQSQERWRGEPSFFRFLGRDIQYYVERMNDPGPTACEVIEALWTLLSAARVAYRFDRGFLRRTGGSERAA